MRTLLLLALALPLAAQTIIEDFRCPTATTVSNANPAVVTCNEPHGWDARPAQARLTITATGPSNGHTVTIDGATYTFVSTVNNANPREVLISRNSVVTARRLVAAINDSEAEEGTGYSSATTAHATMAALNAAFNAETGGGVVSTAADTITWKEHGVVTGTPIGLSNAMPAPFVKYRTYYAIKVDDDTIKVALSESDANNGTAIDITAAPVSFLRLYAPGCASCFADQASTGYSVSITIHAKTAGMSGSGKALSVSNSTNTYWDVSATRIWFNVKITGATGSWAGLGSNATAGDYIATVLSDTTFSVPRNTTSYGSFSGQNITIRTADGAGNMKVLPTAAFSPGISAKITANHAVGQSVPACQSGMSETECSKGYWTPDNQKGYGARGNISSFVVSGTTITITLASAFVDNTPTFEPMDVGRLIFVRGYKAYSTATNPGYDGTPNDPAQSAATLFGSGTVAAPSHRGFYVKSFSGDRRTITIDNPGLVDGTYVGSCLSGCLVVQSAPYVTIMMGATPYIYINNYVSGTSRTFYPASYDFWNSKNPLSFSQNSNRLRFWVKSGKDYQQSSNMSMNWGNYGQTASQDIFGQGGHYYHLLKFHSYRDRWQLVEYNNGPNHQVSGGTSAQVLPDDALRGHHFATYWPGGPRNYMEGQTTHYLDFYQYTNWAGQIQYLAALQYDYAPGEPESWVRSRSAVWNSQRYLSGVMTASPGYHVFWTGAGKGILDEALTGATYSVRYSTTGSLKTNGWSSGADGGVVSGNNFSNYYWDSPEMAEADAMWVAIRPIAPVMGTSGNSVSPVWVHTIQPLHIEAGDTVTVAGVGGNTAANQTGATVVGVKPLTYFWKYVPWVQNRIEQGGLDRIEAASNTCTAHFTQMHGLAVGWPIEVLGSTSAALGSTTWKRYTVASVPTNYSITFACPSVANGTYDTPQTTDSAPFSLVAYPGIAISGSGNGAYTSGGTITSTGNTTGFAEIHLPKYTAHGSAPSAPSSLVANASVGYNEISWTAGSGAEFYVVERRADGGSWLIFQYVHAPTISWVDNSVAAGVTYDYRVKSSNAVAESAYSNIATPGVYTPPVLVTQPASLSNGTVGVAYSVQFNAEGGVGAPYTFSVIGQLCDGLSLSSAGALSGTPTTAQSCSFQVQAEDGAQNTGLQGYSLTIDAAPVHTIEVAGVPVGNVIIATLGRAGLRYSQSCTASAYSDTTGQTVEVTVSTGPARRRVPITGLAPSVSYLLRATCGTETSPSVVVTTEAAATGTAAVTRKIAGGYTHAAIDYSADGSGWTAGDAVACSTGCTLSTPALTRGVPVYIRIRRITSGSDRVIGPAEIVVP